MSDFISVLKEADDFIAVTGADEEKILLAEEILGLTFSEEYKKYLAEFGAACANGHEFTGIINSERLDVVSVTKNAKANNHQIGEGQYVVEKLDIDGILILQDADGIVYEANEVTAPVKIFDSLFEYMVTE